MRRHLVLVVSTVLACALIPSLVVAQTPEDLTKKRDAKPKHTPEELIQKGLEARKAGRNQESIRHLQAAIALMQKEGVTNLASLLPKPLEGWEFKDRKPVSGTWTRDGGAVQWSSYHRTYSKTGDRTKVEITITSSPQIIAPQRQALKTFTNPTMINVMNADPTKKFAIIDEKPWKGWTVVEKGKSAQAIALGETLMITINVNAGDKEILDRHWKGIDRKKLAAADQK